MIHQALRAGADGQATGSAEPAAARDGAVHPAPRPHGEAQGGPLAQRVARAVSGRRAPARRGAARPMPHLIPSELVTSLVVVLPRTAARQRAALLAFAVEERVGAPIDNVVVASARLDDPAAAPGAQLALVISREALAMAAAEAAPGAPLLPDFLALRRPDALPGAPAWAVWRDGARVVVRRSDGTGFAAAADALAALWVRAGRPALLSLGEALPAGLPAIDLSADPPDPDPLDLAAGFRRDGGGVASALRGPLAAAAAIAGAALALHLALAAADAVALGRIAAAERAAADAALARVMPGATVGPDPAPILARLAPSSPEARRSDFLPLLSEASAAIAGSGEAVTLRRLAWGAEDATLSLLVEAAALDDLQAVEQALRGAGLEVTSGAADAGDGGAEVEMRLRRGAAG